MSYSAPHSFHIPVMGLAYTVDSPIKVARYGISSVISIVEDGLIEMMRKCHYPAIQQEYFPITTHEEDYRAKRITDYLNLVNKIVQDQVEKMKNSPFLNGTEIVKYFEMLPEDSKLKHLYKQMMSMVEGQEKFNLQDFLRSQIVPGNIDVNIMTKVDRNRTDKSGTNIEDGSDAVAALRGYAKSDLFNSSVVFSAGMNPRLYNYLEKCHQFAADEFGEFVKKVTIKVSDYRSALIQGKYLAKKGIWPSEFRIESGLNCGGHAFASDGFLMGPILDEFKKKKDELIATLYEIYNNAIKSKGHEGFQSPHPVKITAQGGIGTAEEDLYLREFYNVESTGWGTPFLLVPEATTVDDNTLELLRKAEKKDIVLSNNSPLGVRFHYLRGTTSDLEKQEKIAKGKPGSPCTEKHLAFNTEFTEDPICTASRKYQKFKIAQLQSLGLPENEYQKQLDAVLEKECLCVGLSNSASRIFNFQFFKNQDSVTICPGPNIVNFSKVVSLQTMIDHIYGRTDIMENKQRPHMFISEIGLYVDYFREQLEIDSVAGLDNKKMKYYQEFFKNMMEGIQYYRELEGVAVNDRQTFEMSLDEAEKELTMLEEKYLSPVHQ